MRSDDPRSLPDFCDPSSRKRHLTEVASCFRQEFTSREIQIGWYVLPIEDVEHPINHNIMNHPCITPENWRCARFLTE
jgi:hypothetical protein